jgi:hypothetical protein
LIDFFTLGEASGVLVKRIFTHSENTVVCDSVQTVS